MIKQPPGAVVIPALLIAVGLAAAGYFVGQTMYNAKSGFDTAEVRGLAERRVEADRALWRIQYTVSGDDKNAVPELYAQSESHQQQIMTLLLESGFPESDLTRGVVDFSRQEFRSADQQLVEERFTLTGYVDVETTQVRLVATARAGMNELISRGIDVRNNAPMYYFTRLNDIKPDMLKEATTNARLAANQFAEDAGVAVGGIRNARQGGFTILDVGDNYNAVWKIEKDVRVVSSITFYLTR